MRTLLTLERLKEGQVLEKQVQWSQSFVKGLMQLLYLQHAQVQSASPYSAVDILGQARNIDTQIEAQARSLKGNMLISAPSGYGQVFVPSGQDVLGGSYYSPIYLQTSLLPGSGVGIVVGADNTLAVPAHTGLLQRIFHGQGVAVAGPATFDAVTTGDTVDTAAYGANYWTGVIFNPLRGFKMASFKLLLYRTGSPGTVTAYLGGLKLAGSYPPDLQADTASVITSVATNGNTLPTAAPYEWREFTLAAPLDLNPGFWYCILLKAPTGDSSNKVNLRSGPAIYPRYGKIYTSDGGSSFSVSSSSPLFDLRGSCQIELEYGGCELFGRLTANPNDQFSLRRLFTNKSGSAVNIQESGIYAAAAAYGTFCNAWAFCIARDVIAPAINLPDGQVLQVTYTPQITV